MYEHKTKSKKKCISPSASIALAKVMYLQSIKPMEWNRIGDLFFSLQFFFFYFVVVQLGNVKTRATTRHILKSIVVRITVDRYNERLLTFSKITRLFRRFFSCVSFHLCSVLFCCFFFSLLSRFFLYLDIARFGVVCKKFQPEIIHWSCDICVLARHTPKQTKQQRKTTTNHM